MLNTLFKFCKFSWMLSDIICLLLPFIQHNTISWKKCSILIKNQIFPARYPIIEVSVRRLFQVSCIVSLSTPSNSMNKCLPSTEQIEYFTIYQQFILINILKVSAMILELVWYYLTCWEIKTHELRNIMVQVEQSREIELNQITFIFTN